MNGKWKLWMLAGGALLALACGGYNSPDGGYQDAGYGGGGGHYASGGGSATGGGSGAGGGTYAGGGY